MEDLEYHEKEIVHIVHREEANNRMALNKSAANNSVTDHRK